MIFPMVQPRGRVRLLAAALLAVTPWASDAAFAQSAAPVAESPVSGAAKPRRQPPPAVIPTAEVQAADAAFKAGRYDSAVASSKAALNKNERYTPAMLIMAKAYYKLGKFEWTRKLWEMMQANGASEGEKAEIYQLLAFLEIQQKNTPGAIQMLKKATEAKPDDAILWNNLGAEYLVAKNYRDATPALERATQLQPAFSKAHLNLGGAYRGGKEYEKALASYQRALQLFPNYADAVFNLGILYLDAEKMPNTDVIAKLNTSISYFQKYKQMMGATLPPGDLADTYALEAQDKISKEQKRIERQKKAEEREKQRAAQKAAKTSGVGGAMGAPGVGGAPGTVSTPTTALPAGH